MSLFAPVYKPKKIENIRIPYMGSKNKIAVKLIDKMLEIKPKARYFNVSVYILKNLTIIFNIFNYINSNI
jgi:hypothetical protein